MKKIFINGILAGIILTIISYGGLYLSIRFFPFLFEEYNNPLFHSDGSRDVLFYSHTFIISFALSWFWENLKTIFRGNFLFRGIQFGCTYTLVGVVPILWITFASMDVTLLMVGSWLLYAFIQSIIAGMFFAKRNP
ncbi:MAG: hypothetical protein EKK39_09965 [Sphingobacteriales bacterium]|uniref:hypothetical protein n=1 Tax=Hydrotalea flava TaxID=714549 RepID=UPI000834F020|nr:hypothetical protein [Hydrotalea flava]RTL49964.1 MAG: hypothetical protein EKK39_09965 [Sphingobacteriales bacterium]